MKSWNAPQEQEPRGQHEPHRRHEPHPHATFGLGNPSGHEPHHIHIFRGLATIISNVTETYAAVARLAETNRLIVADLAELKATVSKLAADLEALRTKG